jgi:hypothetical protein
MGILDVTLEQTLEHIAAINDGQNCGARCPFGEMIQVANEAERDGLCEWRDNEKGYGYGRWLTDAGRAALAEHRRGK